MPLSLPEVERELTHTRRLRYEGYRRADGLWDIEAHLTDVKNHDLRLLSGLRRAGLPVHEMWIRLTIDTGFNVLAAAASSDAVPYPGACEAVAPDYARLVGTHLLHGFRRRSRELFGRTRGCSHLTEMLDGFPTAALQTFAGERKRLADDPDRPFELDQCRALKSDSDTVRRYYPRWFRQTATSEESI